MIARKPQPAEFDLTVNLYSQWHDEFAEATGADYEDYDVNSVIDHIRESLVNVDTAWFILLDRNRPVGFAGLAAGVENWNHNQTSTLLTDFWVLASHRTTDNMQALLDKCLEWHRSIRARSMLVEHDITRLEDFNSFFQRQDFTPMTFLSREVE
jgi:hypothetical protein